MRDFFKTECGKIDETMKFFQLVEECPTGMKYGLMMLILMFLEEQDPSLNNEIDSRALIDYFHHKMMNSGDS